jgi:hypothetical protein
MVVVAGEGEGLLIGAAAVGLHTGAHHVVACSGGFDVDFGHGRGQGGEGIGGVVARDGAGTRGARAGAGRGIGFVAFLLAVVATSGLLGKGFAG